MRNLLSVLAVCALAACAVAPLAADPASDAPEPRPALAVAVSLPVSYADALRSWHSAEEVNAWIGARFEYDADRAAKLSENQRALVGHVEIHKPEAFFAEPSGVCVDLARFAVETLRAVAPISKPAYLMNQYAQYRERRIVSHRTLDSFERKRKKRAPGATHKERA